VFAKRRSRRHPEDFLYYATGQVTVAVGAAVWLWSSDEPSADCEALSSHPRPMCPQVEPGTQLTANVGLKQVLFRRRTKEENDRKRIG